MLIFVSIEGGNIRFKQRITLQVTVIEMHFTKLDYFDLFETTKPLGYHIMDQCAMKLL